jgi:CO/xanthine dehydrogenase Mo-binding subunit
VALVPRIVRSTYEYEGRTRESITVVEDDTVAPWGAEARLSVVGRPHPRVDAVERVTGAARYTADIALPGMLHGRVVRSPHPRARVQAVDAAAARGLPGVHLVLTPDGIPDDLPQPLQTEVHFEGEEVALVVAETPEQAEDALGAVRVDYEVLQPVATWEQALAPGAPEAVEGGNLGHGGKPDVWEHGDVEAALAQSEIVFEGDYATAVQLHTALEPHGSVAWWQPGRLTVWASTQAIADFRNGLAEAYGLPRDRVRVIAEYIGGGFGAKWGPDRIHHLAVIASRLTGRPVRLMLTRHEENLCAGNRPGTRQHLRIGAGRDGRLRALSLRSYSLDGARGGGGTVGGPVRDMYAAEAVRTEEFSVYTNTGPACAFRAPGYPEGAFALESALDELAERLGLDPLELRRRNHAASRWGKPFSSNSLLEMYEVGARAIGWERREALARENRGRRVVRGLGMAAGCWGSAGWPPAHAWVQLQGDGTVTVTSATQDIGTGSKTALALCAAEEMGVPLEAVEMRIGDTDGAPHGTGSGGSGTVSSMAPAVRAAAADARRQLLEIAGSYLDLPPDALRLEGGVLSSPERPDIALSLRELLRDLGPLNIVGRGGRAPNPSDLAVLAAAVHFAEVEVDTWTAAVRVVRYVAVHESGRVINPLTMSAQVEGGVVFGIGYALTEERVVDPRRAWALNANLEDYQVPTVADVPAVQAILLDRPDERLNNAGVKGIGEPPVIPPAPAICNAIHHACGVRLREIPVTRARLLAALSARPAQ